MPADAAEEDGFISELYAHLVGEAAAVLNHRIRLASVTVRIVDTDIHEVIKNTCMIYIGIYIYMK